MSDPAAADDPCPDTETEQEPGAEVRVFNIINKKGLHARASAKFVQTVEQFDADVRVTRCGESVGGDSIMGLMPDDAVRRPRHADHGLRYRGPSFGLPGCLAGAGLEPLRRRGLRPLRRAAPRASRRT
jgi:hypothetical protein